VVPGPARYGAYHIRQDAADEESNMESFIVIAILVTIVSVYLLQQYRLRTLEVDDARHGDLPPEHDAAELKAA
jgi:hypothetical protein